MADGHHHGHVHRQDSQRRLTLALGFTGTVFVAELVGGLVTGSLALLSDAAHMFLDVLALATSYFAIRIAARPADVRHTFGYHRVQAVSALANAATLVLVAVGIFREAWHRLSDPPEIIVGPMLVVAVVGLVSNIASALVLHGHEEEDINVRGAFLHVLGDGLASMGVIVAGLVILFTGQTVVDSLVSVLIGAIVAYSSIGLLRRSLHVLTEGTPEGLSLDEVVAAMRGVPGVTEVHDLHAWSLGPGFSALSAHVIINAASLPEVQEIMFQLRTLLHDQFDIEHRTIQVEWANCGQGELTCYIPVLPPVADAEPPAE